MEEIETTTTERDVTSTAKDVLGYALMAYVAVQVTRGFYGLAQGANEWRKSRHDKKETKNEEE